MVPLFKILLLSKTIGTINIFFSTDINYPVGETDQFKVVLNHPHNSSPRPASAAVRLKQQLAATSAAGAFDVDSSGSDATAE